MTIVFSNQLDAGHDKPTDCNGGRSRWRSYGQYPLGLLLDKVF